MRKRWIFKTQEPGAAEELARELGLSPVAARLLCGRGLADPAAARAFLEKAERFDPYLLRDMDRAVARIRAALKSGEKIAVYGDYDVDGVTSTALLVTCLRELGGDVCSYIPARQGEGYGLNAAALRRLAEQGCSLVITVDTGITATQEAQAARELSLSLVVTDHHQCAEALPECDAVVNPHRPDCPYPFKELAGVGVALKLAQALGAETEAYLDLAALGTVADVMPLVGENRTIVSRGLAQIGRSGRVGLAALIEESGLSDKKIGAGTVGFTLAPRINAAGRMADASAGVELLLTEDTARAGELARELSAANAERQAEEGRILSEALARGAEFAESPAIVLGADGWHSGVIGIVASRLVERFYKPVLLVSFDGEEGHGSGRSVAGFDLAEALRACEDSLVKCGGHAMAAGLTVTREAFPAFREAFLRYAGERLTEELLTPKVEIDATVTAAELTKGTVEELSKLEPYGMGNPTPTFAVLGAEMLELIPLSGGKHTKLELLVEGRRFQALRFGLSPEALGYLPGERVDLVCTLDLNRFRGNETLQLMVRELRTPPETGAPLAAAEKLFARFLKGEALPAGFAAAACPSRAECGALYRFLGSGRRGPDWEALYRAAGMPWRAGARGNAPEPGFFKFLAAAQSFLELGLLEHTEGELLEFRRPPAVGKRELSKSETMARLLRAIEEEK